MCHNLITQLIPKPKEEVGYTPQLAMVIARVMSNIKNKTMVEGASFCQQYILQKCLEKLGYRGSKIAAKEMDQLDHNLCTPIDVEELTSQEKRKSMEALMCLKQEA